MIINYSPLIIVQTYIVAGGYTGSDRLSSTEVLVETGSAWTLTGELPTPRYGLRGANIENKIVMTGNCTHSLGKVLSRYLGVGFSLTRTIF